MKGLVKFLSKNKRSIFYAFLTGLGLAFSIQLFKDYGTEKFLIGVLITGLILFFEIYMNWRYATKILRQIDMPSINVYNLWGHLVNHITLPGLLLLSFVGFVYFNDDDLIRLISIFFLIIINVMLFINIRSYYEDEFRVEEGTRYVYDVIKLVIFFFGVNFLLHIGCYWQIEIWIISLLVCFLSLGLGILLIYHKGEQQLSAVLYAILVSFIISVFFMVLSFMGLVLLGVNVITFLLFYFSLAVLHHRIDRTLTLEVFVEYFLILIFALFIFLGIS